MAEEWRPVPGHEGRYEVSSEGRVRSVSRLVNSKNGSKAKKRGRILRPCKSARTGYLAVTLSTENRRTTHNVHRLVCEAFHGAPPIRSAQVAHGDGVRTNNRADNLRWTTAKGNAADRNEHGTAPIGEGAGNHKITESDVLAIRRAFTGKRGDLSWLGRKFGITKQQVRNIVQRKQWTHI